MQQQQKEHIWKEHTKVSKNWNFEVISMNNVKVIHQTFLYKKVRLKISGFANFEVLFFYKIYGVRKAHFKIEAA